MTGERIHLDLPDGRSSVIHIGPGAWDLLPGHLASHRPSAVALVIDETVLAAHGKRLVSLLDLGGSPPLVHPVPAGEGSKSFAELSRACRFLAGARLSRDALVVAAGGGVIGDLAGLAASLFLRGVRLVQVPTSLLAMVDSSVGGKNAINIPEGKNLLGTVYQPEAVFADTRVLSTLPPREWHSGMAEVVKTALTLDLALLALLERTGLGSADVDPTPLIAASCARKGEVVAADEREQGWRRVLNFGHTLAHALEAGEGFGSLRHGEAVVEGMKAALVLSRDLAGLSRPDFLRARRLLERFPPAPGGPARAPSREALLPYLQRDKKSRGGKVTCVLLAALAKPVFVPIEDPNALVDAWNDWEK